MKQTSLTAVKNVYVSARLLLEAAKRDESWTQRDVDQLHMVTSQLRSLYKERAAKELLHAKLAFATTEYLHAKQRYKLIHENSN